MSTSSASSVVYDLTTDTFLVTWEDGTRVRLSSDDFAQLVPAFRARARRDIPAPVPCRKVETFQEYKARGGTITNAKHGQLPVVSLEDL